MMKYMYCKNVANIAKIVDIFHECVSFMIRSMCAFCTRYLAYHEIDPDQITITRVKSLV